MRILVDFDSTIVDILTPVLKILNERYNKTVECCDLTSWDAILEFFPKKEFYSVLQQDNFYLKNVLPIEGSIEFIKKLSENNEVIIVTSGQKTVGKVEYIYKHFGEYIQNVVFTQYKNKVDGDVLIDDRFANIYNWVKDTNKRGFLFSNRETYKYNDNLWHNYLYKRCSTYEEILSHIL